MKKDGEKVILKKGIHVFLHEKISLSSHYRQHQYIDDYTLHTFTSWQNSRVLSTGYNENLVLDL